MTPAFLIRTKKRPPPSGHWRCRCIKQVSSRRSRKKEETLWGRIYNPPSNGGRSKEATTWKRRQSGVAANDESERSTCRVAIVGFVSALLTPPLAAVNRVSPEITTTEKKNNTTQWNFCRSPKFFGYFRGAPLSVVLPPSLFLSLSTCPGKMRLSHSRINELCSG